MNMCSLGLSVSKHCVCVRGGCQTERDRETDPVSLSLLFWISVDQAGLELKASDFLVLGLKPCATMLGRIPGYIYCCLVPTLQDPGLA